MSSTKTPAQQEQQEIAALPPVETDKQQGEARGNRRRPVRDRLREIRATLYRVLAEVTEAEGPTVQAEGEIAQAVACLGRAELLLPFESKGE